MLTANLAQRTPIDRGISVIVDLPHAADQAARPQLCSLMTADTHDPVNGVIGMSMHFDGDATPGNYELWIVAEQYVDENDEPLPPGALLTPSFHTEYFRGTLRTALFRYRVAGFTTGARFDQDSTWHPQVRDVPAADGEPQAKPSGLTEFEVTFKNLLKTHVTARHFGYADGFVSFYLPDGRCCAAFLSDETLSVRTIPHKRVLMVDDEQLRVLRSALLWDEQRVTGTDAAADYRAQLRDVLTRVLGVDLPDLQPAAGSPMGGSCVEPDADEDAGEPNDRTRCAAGRLDELVERH